MAETRRKRLGDRRDGRRLRTLDPYTAMFPFLMKKKSGSSNYFSDSVEITETEKYLREKRLNGYPGMGILHLFIATYIRVAAKYPAVNRFISGQRLYARNNIEFVMTVKKEMKIAAPETSIKATFDPKDTIFDVYRKLNVEIEKVKNDMAETSTDNIAKMLIKLPRILLKFAIFVLECLDYFGLLPRFLLNASPFHGSVIITDMGSIGVQAIYHHLYDFGNMPVFIALGVKRKERETKQDGTVAEKKYIDFKLVVDERICDGFYFSQAFKLFRSILRKPVELDEPPQTVEDDIE